MNGFLNWTREMDERLGLGREGKGKEHTIFNVRTVEMTGT
jgi:hypothetical protein